MLCAALLQQPQAAQAALRQGLCAQLDQGLSEAILRQARDQQAELASEDLAAQGLSGIAQARPSAWPLQALFS